MVPCGFLTTNAPRPIISTVLLLLLLSLLQLIGWLDIKNAEHSLNGETRINTSSHHRGKYHSTADLLFDWFEFDQTSKTTVQST